MVMMMMMMTVLCALGLYSLNELKLLIESNVKKKIVLEEILICLSR